MKFLDLTPAQMGCTGTIPGMIQKNGQGVWIPGQVVDAGYAGYGNRPTLALYGTTTTPEPSSLALLGTGLIALVPVMRRKRSR